MTGTHYACSGSSQRPCKLKESELQCMLHKKPAQVCNESECLSKIIYSTKQCRHNHDGDEITEADDNARSSGPTAQPLILTTEALLTLMSQQNKDKSSSSIRCEPLEFPKNIAEYQTYKKDIVRWSRVCGIPLALQGETILMKISKTNVFKTQLDNAIGARCEDMRTGSPSSWRRWTACWARTVTWRTSARS